jgi:hypothetical protein
MEGGRGGEGDVAAHTRQERWLQYRRHSLSASMKGCVDATHATTVEVDQIGMANMIAMYRLMFLGDRGVWRTDEDRY